MSFTVCFVLFSMPRHAPPCPSMPLHAHVCVAQTGGVAPLLKEMYQGTSVGRTRVCCTIHNTAFQVQGVARNPHNACASVWEHSLEMHTKAPHVPSPKPAHPHSLWHARMPADTPCRSGRSSHHKATCQCAHSCLTSAVCKSHPYSTSTRLPHANPCLGLLSAFQGRESPALLDAVGLDRNTVFTPDKMQDDTHRYCFCHLPSFLPGMPVLIMGFEPVWCLLAASTVATTCVQCSYDDLTFTFTSLLDLCAGTRRASLTSTFSRLPLCMQTLSPQFLLK